MLNRCRRVQVGGRRVGLSDGIMEGGGWDITMNHNSFTPLVLQADAVFFSLFLTACHSSPLPFTTSVFYHSVLPFGFSHFIPTPVLFFSSLFRSLTSALPVRPRACSHFRWVLKRDVTRWCECVFVCVRVDPGSASNIGLHILNPLAKTGTWKKTFKACYLVTARHVIIKLTHGSAYFKCEVIWTLGPMTGADSVKQQKKKWLRSSNIANKPFDYLHTGRCVCHLDIWNWFSAFSDILNGQQVVCCFCKLMFPLP